MRHYPSIQSHFIDSPFSSCNYVIKLARFLHVFLVILFMKVLYFFFFYLKSFVGRNEVFLFF